MSTLKDDSSSELYSPTQSMSLYCRFNRSIRSVSVSSFFYSLRIFIWARCRTYSATSFTFCLRLFLVKYKTSKLKQNERQEQRIILKETFTGFQQTQTFSVKLKTVVGNGVYKICKIFFPRVSILNLEEALKFRFNIPFF